MKKPERNRTVTHEDIKALDESGFADGAAPMGAGEYDGGRLEVMLGKGRKLEAFIDIDGIQFHPDKPRTNHETLEYNIEPKILDRFRKKKR